MGDAESTVHREHFPLLGPYVAPQTPSETIVERIWRKAFNMDLVGTADTYEDLGGDSLIAVSILAELNEAYKMDVPSGLLEDTSTIRQLAQEIDKLK